MYLLSIITGLTTVTYGFALHTNLEIYGGKDITIEKYPYQLALLYHGEFFCGASIIDQKWALTSAGCTNVMFPEDLSVRAGSSVTNETGQVVQVKEIYQHPNYTFADRGFDISLLELNSNIEIGSTAAVILLADVDTVIADGKNATVTGWAFVDQYSDYARELQVVDIPIVGEEECNNAYAGSRNSVSDSMICAGLYHEGIGACNGDQGGPLVMDNKQIGITSWNYGCSDFHFPDVYTRISSYRQFIKDISGI